MLRLFRTMLLLGTVATTVALAAPRDADAGYWYRPGFTSYTHGFNGYYYYPSSAYYAGPVHYPYYTSYSPYSTNYPHVSSYGYGYYPTYGYSYGYDYGYSSYPRRGGFFLDIGF